jgi:hypothetical protein
MVMDVIAEARGVEIYAEEDWGFSFFTSPYIAHREFGAVDIYQNRDFGEVALSPVTGRVYKTLKFDSPSLGRSLPEYLILVKTGDYLARIMHVEPAVEEGDVIHAGDEIGRFITNGFFFFWVDAGMHVEVRDLKDYLRAKGAYELKPVFKADITGEKQASDLNGVVLKANKCNVAVKLNRGNLVEINGVHSLMDCVTSMDYGGVLGRFNPGDGVYFNGIEIGKISKVGSYMSIFQTEKLRVFANEIEFKGISYMFGREIVHLLPERYGKPLLDEGEKVKIKIEPQVK